jgi:hypothetical protein
MEVLQAYTYYTYYIHLASSPRVIAISCDLFVLREAPGATVEARGK